MADKDKLTEHENKVLALAWQCFKTAPEIDIEKLSKLAGYTNSGSTRNAFARIKQKLSKVAGSVDDNNENNTASPNTMKKSAAKTGAAKDTLTKAGATAASGKDTPTKVIRAPRAAATAAARKRKMGDSDNEEEVENDDEEDRVKTKGNGAVKEESKDEAKKPNATKARGRGKAIPVSNSNKKIKTEDVASDSFDSDEAERGSRQISVSVPAAKKAAAPSATATTTAAGAKKPQQQAQQPTTTTATTTAKKAASATPIPHFPGLAGNAKAKRGASAGADVSKAGTAEENGRGARLASHERERSKTVEAVKKGIAGAGGKSAMQQELIKEEGEIESDEGV